MAELSGRSAPSGVLLFLMLFLMSGCLAASFIKLPRLTIGLLSLVLLLGSGRMAWELRTDPLEQILSQDALQGVTAEGRLSRITEKNGVYTLTVTAAEIDAGGQLFSKRRLSVTVEAATLLAVYDAVPTTGQKIRAEGKLERFSEARNPGEFDYQLYYRGLKLRYRLRAKAVSVRSGQPSLFQLQTARFQAFAKATLQRLCPVEDAGVFQAILLGDKSELSAELSDLFGDSGIAHILAVSGLHVSLIGMSLYRGLRKIGAGYGTAGLLSAALLIFYGSVTGFGASVFRAVLMIFCALFAAWLGRTYDLLSAMAVALFLLAADSPLLLCSGGLQLSFGAVAAIGLEQDRQRRQIAREVREETRSSGEKETPAAGLVSTLVMSVRIQQLTAPIVLYHFFRFPLFGLLLNLVVIPLMSYAAGCGILAVGLCGIGTLLTDLWMYLETSWSGFLLCRVLQGAAGLLEQAASALIGPGHYIFAFYRTLCGWSLTLPFSSVVAGRPSLPKIILYYLILVVLYAGALNRQATAETKCKSAGFCAGLQSRSVRGLLFALAVGVLCIRPLHGLEVWFLDVGQGDAVWIQSKDTTILYDCGSSQMKMVGRDRLVPFLESRGVTEIDYILVSHGDNDHISGIVWLLEQEPDIRVGCLVLPQPGRGQEIYEELSALAAGRGIRVQYMSRGEELTEGELRLSCLHPPETETGIGESDRNGHSLVFALEYRNFTMLLTGDIGAEQEQLLLSEQLLPYDPSEIGASVLKAAHHGSGNSTSQPFIDAVKPGAVVISYGKGNSYGHPSETVVRAFEERGIRVWETAVSGAVYIRTDGKKMTIKGWLPKRVDRNGENGL